MVVGILVGLEALMEFKKMRPSLILNLIIKSIKINYIKCATTKNQFFSIRKKN